MNRMTKYKNLRKSIKIEIISEWIMDNQNEAYSLYEECCPERMTSDYDPIDRDFEGVIEIVKSEVEANLKFRKKVMNYE